MILTMPKKMTYKRWGPKYDKNRNWRVYNKQLIRRGELFISLDFLDNWDKELALMNHNKVGRKFIYPEKFIKWTAIIYQGFNLPYRLLQGYLRKLSTYIPRLEAADYTTLYRRIKDVKLDLKDTIPAMSGPLVVAVDSSGIKTTTRGEWIKKKWRVQKERRGWIKMHLAVDTRRKEILAVDITDESVCDHSRFNELMDQCQENIGRSYVERVLADGAYDRSTCFNYLKRHRMKSGIKLRKDATRNSKKSPFRLTNVWMKKQLGYDKWKSYVSYSKRWSSEAVFSCVKRMLGEHVRAKSKAGEKREAYRKFVVYNLMNNYGRGKVSPF